MSKKKDDLTKEKKQPLKVFRKCMMGTLLGFTALVGTVGLSGCSDGKNGATWLSGVDNPIDTQVKGNPGDFYFDEDDFDIFKYTQDGWVFIGNIEGEDADPAVDGDSVVFRTTNSAIEWKYSKQGDDKYVKLIDLPTNGTDGDNVVFRTNNGKIQWKLSKQEDSAYTDLIALSELTGEDGKKLEMTYDGEYIKYRYEGDTDYTNLVHKSQFKGDDGKSAYEVAVDAGYSDDIDAWLLSLKGKDADNIVLRKGTNGIEWKYSSQQDTEYQLLISTKDITGTAGVDGDKVVLNVSGGKLQWKYSQADDETYADLFDLTTLTGKDGKKLEITYDGSHVKYRYEGDKDYINLISKADLKGADGKSAYEVAVDAGYSDDIDAWLLSLKGKDADNIVLRKGTDGIEWKYSSQQDTEYQLLISTKDITGAAGVDGDKVILNVADGMLQWKYSQADDETYADLFDLTTLAGKNGKNIEITSNGEYIQWNYAGETTYTNVIAVADLKGADGKSAYEIAVNAGFEGDVSTWLASLKGVSITDVDVTYDIDNDGNEFTVYTFYFSNGLDEKVRVAMPKRIESIYLVGDTSYPMCEVGEEPTLNIRVDYENGTSELVPVTEDMFVIDDKQGLGLINFQELGYYNIKIKYQGKTTETQINIVDPNDTSITYIGVGTTPIITVSGSDFTLADYEDIDLNIQLNNGQYETRKLSDPDVTVNFDNYSALNTPFDAQVSYAGQNTTMRVLPVESLASVEFNSTGSYNGDDYFIIDKNTEIDFKGATITMKTSVGGNDYYYSLPVTHNMLKNLDNTTVSDSAPYIFDTAKTYGVDPQVSINVSVVDTTAEGTKLMSYSGQGTYLAGTSSIEDVQLYAYYQTKDGNNFRLPVSQDGVQFSGSTDFFDEIGEYQVAFTKDKTPGMVSITIYDPAVCNVRDINFDNYSLFYDLSIAYGADSEAVEALVTSLVGQEASVNHYEPVNGDTTSQIITVLDNFDCSNLDTSVPGTYVIYYDYTVEGQSVAFRKEIEVNVVVDLEGSNIVMDYIVDTGLSSWYSSITTYDNGIVVLVPSTGGDTEYAQYTIVGDELRFYDSLIDGEVVCKITTAVEPETRDTLNFYIPDDTVVKETFTLTMTIYNTPMPVSLELYADSSYDVDTAVGSYYTMIKLDSMYDMEYATIEVQVDKTTKTLVWNGITYTIKSDNSLTVAG